jgi:excisionase family DNA binding protein
MNSHNVGTFCYDEGKGVPEERPLVTVSEAAAELGLTVHAVTKRLRQGQMHGEQVHPRLWLIPREEVERMKAIGPLKRGPKPKAEE